MTFLPPRSINLTSALLRKKGSHAPLRALGAFIVLLLVLLLPLAFVQGIRILKGYVQSTKQELVAQGEEALGALSGGMLAISRTNFLAAHEEFARTSRALEEAGNTLERTVQPWERVVGLFPLYRAKLTTARALLQAGKSFTQLATLSADAMSRATSFLNARDRDMVLHQTESVVQKMLPVGDQLQGTLARIDAQFLPDALREDFVSLPLHIADFRKATQESITLLHALSEALGAVAPQRYAVVFQNNAELRPTGGFMGSLAMIEVSHGRITHLEVPKGGIYDVAGQIHAGVMAPRPLWLVNANWNIQDANWFPDFPTSAQKVLWFWNQSGWPPLDGIITFTPHVFEEVLRVLGPIGPIGPMHTTLSAENAVSTIQELTSGQPHETKTPKEFLAKVTPVVLDRIATLQGKDLASVAGAFIAAISSKHLLFYATRPVVQKVIEDMGASGRIENTFGDYLFVVGANIRGSKTDRVIKTSLTRHATLNADGSINAELTLERSHEGVKGVKFTGVRNYTYFRFYVPLGATLKGMSGFSSEPTALFETPDPLAILDKDLVRLERVITEKSSEGAHIAEEFNRTVFGVWTILDPGEQKTLTLRYSVPAPALALSLVRPMYRFFLQKQPGTLPLPFTNILTLAPSWHASSAMPEDATVTASRVTWQGVVNEDMIQEVVLRAP